MARGWLGSPPRDDDDARERIIDATRRCVQQFGPQKTGLSDVAKALGVTRQTVYRHFGSAEELLTAVARTAADDYLDSLTAHLATYTDPADALVEGIAFTLERLPDERHLGVLLATGHTQAFLRGVTTPEAKAFGRAMLDRMNVDWKAWEYQEKDLDSLAEYGLRVLQSLVLDPPALAVPAKRKPAQLRALLHRWVAPAVHRSAARG